MTAVIDAPRTRLVRLAALSLMAITAVGAVVGLVSVTGDLGLRLGSSGQTTHHRMNEDVYTSFGVVAVEFVRQVDGVTHRQLAGASHGISGLVNADQAQIQVAVAITNRVDHPIAYTSKQFTLLATHQGKTKTLHAQGGDLPDSRILPDAGIEGHLDFTVPSGVSSLTLRFRDPGAARPVLIDVGFSRPTKHANGSGHEH